MISLIILMIRRPPRSTHCISSAASDVYKRQGEHFGINNKIVDDDKDTYKKYDVIPCLLYTSPSPRDLSTSRMPSSA